MNSLIYIILIVLFVVTSAYIILGRCFILFSLELKGKSVFTIKEVRPFYYILENSKKNTIKVLGLYRGDLNTSFRYLEYEYGSKLYYFKDTTYYIAKVHKNLVLACLLLLLSIVLVGLI